MFVYYYLNTLNISSSFSEVPGYKSWSKRKQIFFYWWQSIYWETHVAFNQCYILKKSVICSSWYTITTISLFSQQILGARLYKDLRLNDQYKVIIFYEVRLWCKQRYYPSCSTRTFFDGYKITHSCMIFVVMAQFIPPNPTQFVFFLHVHCQNPCHDFPFSLEKTKRKSESYIFDNLNISKTVCLQRPLQFQLKLTSSR